MKGTNRDVGTLRPVDVIGQRTHNSILQPDELLLLLLPLLALNVAVLNARVGVSAPDGSENIKRERER